MPQANQEQQTVRINQVGQLLYVDPAIAPLTSLRTSELRMVTQPTGRGYRVERVQRPLYRTADLTGQLLFQIGYAEILRSVLADAGYAINYRRSEGGPLELPPPEISAVPFVSDADRHFLEWIHGSPRGLIQLLDTEDTFSTITRIAQAYPSARIAIADDNTDRNRQPAALLRRQMSSVGLYTAGTPMDIEDHRVVVSTFYGLCPARIEWRHIVIVPDAPAALSERGDLALEQASRARLFGMLGPHQRPSPAEHDRLIGKFGLDVFRIAPPGFRVMPIRVRRHRISGGPRIRSGGDLTRFKQVGIWKHAIRNRYVVRVASNLARDLQQVLQVAVLVENVEHALHLSHQLPGWPVVTGGAVQPGGLRRWQRDLLANSEIDHSTRNIIVTFCGLQQIDICRANVIIRADGGLGIPFTDVVPWNSPNSDVQLIDFDDRHHPQLRRWSADRWDAYLERGWFPVGADPIEQRVRQFLRQRPRSTT